MKKVLYKYFICEALNYFQELDAFDVHLLVQKFENQERIEIADNSDLGVLKMCIVFFDDKYYLKSLDSSNLSPKKSLSYIKKTNNIKIPSNLTNFFRNLDLSEYYSFKEKTFYEGKKKTLKEANVLLISSSDEDYIALQNYGFENIDVFKSRIRAVNFFKKNPNIANKYHIVLFGKQETILNYSNGQMDIPGLSYNDCRNKQIVDGTIYKADGKAFLSYRNNYLNLFLRTPYKELDLLFDDVIKAVLMNYTFDVHDLQETQYPKVEDYLTLEKKTLPKKVKDLKILCCGIDKPYFNPYNIAQKKGLNVVFKKDYSYRLASDIQFNLGEYDIIIATEIFSSKLKYMNNESTEQCKDTGRQLTLLLTFLDKPNYITNIYNEKIYLGRNIKLNACFGGPLAINKDRKSYDFNILSLDEALWEETIEEGLLGCAVNLYNEQLIKINSVGLKDISFRNPIDYEKEYRDYEDNEKLKKQKLLEPLLLVDRVRELLSKYLFYHKLGLINDIKSLHVEELKSFYKADNYVGDRLLCSVYIPKCFDDSLKRMLKVKILTNKGGYTDLKDFVISLEKDDLSMPVEWVLVALNSIYKKTSYVLSFVDDKESVTKDIEYDNSKILIKDSDKK